MRGYIVFIAILTLIFLLSGGVYLFFKNFQFPKENIPKTVLKKHIIPQESQPKITKKQTQIESQKKPQLTFSPYIKTKINLLSKSEDRILRFELYGYDFLNNEEIKNFQIKVLPIFKDWKYSGKYFQISNIPNENITIIARAVNKNLQTGKEDILNFKSTLSPFAKNLKITLTRFSSPQEIQIQNIGTSSVNLEGFKIKTSLINLTLEKTNKVLYPLLFETKESLILNPGERLILLAQKSPIGINFKINRCLHFYPGLENFKEGTCFLPEIPNYLPAKCKEKISRLTCRFIDLNTISKEFGFFYECQKFVEENFTYKGCFEKNNQKKDFHENKWYYFLGERTLVEKFDELIFLDPNGLVIEKVQIR